MAENGPIEPELVPKEAMPKKKTGRGGARPGSGRPKGSRNKPKNVRQMRQEFKELLEPLDRAGAMRLMNIILKGEDEKTVLEAIRIAFEYRHGKPLQVAAAGPGEPGAGGLAIETDTTNVLVVGGDEASYVNSLRALRGENPLPAPKKDTGT